VEKEKKLQIIKAAIKRFWKHGLKKTTLEEIARDLRIGKASIYHYFKSKDELYQETISWETSLFFNEVKTIFQNTEIQLNEKLIQYFNYKESIHNNYKLIYELLLNILNERSHEQEIKLLKNILSGEEEILKNAISSIKESKDGNVSEALINFLVSQSWGLVFVNILKEYSQQGNNNISKEGIIKELGNIFYK